MTQPTPEQVGTVTQLVTEIARRYLLFESGLASDLDELSKPELQVLELIALYSVDNVTQVARVGQVPVSTASWLVNNLVERGYLSRRTDSADRRIQRLELAPKGEDVLAFLERAFEAMAGLMLDAATEPEAEMLVSLSERIVGSLQSEPAI